MQIAPAMIPIFVFMIMLGFRFGCCLWNVTQCTAIIGPSERSESQKYPGFPLANHDDQSERWVLMLVLDLMPIRANSCQLFSFLRSAYFCPIFCYVRYPLNPSLFLSSPFSVYSAYSVV